MPPQSLNSYWSNMKADGHLVKTDEGELLLELWADNGWKLSLYFDEYGECDAIKTKLEDGGKEVIFDDPQVGSLTSLFYALKNLLNG